MITKPLYLENSYLKQCTAKIVEVSPTTIVLNQTIFYPEGGGQPCDQGVIKSSSGNTRIDKVSLKGDKIVHEGKVQGTLQIGDEVECEIDWDRRYKNMQVHSAGHVLHESIKKLIPNATPIEGQHGKKPYIKYQDAISKTLEEPLMSLANQIIAQDLEIQTEFVSLDELKKRSSWIPPHLPTNKPLRIMWIGDLPPIPDGGTQVKSTGEISLFSRITIEGEGTETKVYYATEQPEIKSHQTPNRTFVEIDATRLLNLKNEGLAMIIQAKDVEELERLRIQYLGKSGLLAQLAKDLPKLEAAERAEMGHLFNDVKQTLNETFCSQLKTKDSSRSIEADLSLPGIPINIGLLHPITATARAMNTIFQSLGFSVADGPEIENDEFNYNRLNLPADHPARDLQDSLYIKEPDIMLRTHTSSVEAHILADHQPPYRFVFPGKSYRYENANASNHYMFFQYQGVAVGEHITMANLKWTLETFINQFYGPQRKSRFRCKYYPEVEPGVGVDIDCPFCKQKGCSVCKNRGWIEILGGGMIHPNLFKRVGLDPQKYSGFAWGMGLDRIAMTRYGITDIRSLYNGDLIYKI